MTSEPAATLLPCAGLRRRMLVGLVAAAVLALSACSSGAPSPDATTASATKTTLTSDSAGSSSRAQTYTAVADLADSSDLIIVGTAGNQRAVADLPGTDLQFTLTDVTTQEVLRGDVATDTSVVVRQTPLVETLMLRTGGEYLLYLTRSGLDGELAEQYYVTGVTAGIYTADLADVLGAGFQRLDEASGDNLPSQLLTAQALGRNVTETSARTWLTNAESYAKDWRRSSTSAMRTAPIGYRSACGASVTSCAVWSTATLVGTEDASHGSPLPGAP